MVSILASFAISKARDTSGVEIEPDIESTDGLVVYVLYPLTRSYLNPGCVGSLNLSSYP